MVRRSAARRAVVLWRDGLGHVDGGVQMVHGLAGVFDDHLGDQGARARSPCTWARKIPSMVLHLMSASGNRADW
ncbi:hypothetical protein [Lichenicoccus sp.]|uniref:hypothetical protein n=1 Tax=Lichenicoccus sp. TaxID=2781899 RepID=UPI003D0E6BE1